jgi:hypothetical protein
MKRKFALWTPLAALLLAAGVAQAAGLSDDTLNKLMDLSGINKQVGSFPEMIQAGVDQAAAQAKAQAAAQQKPPVLSDQDFGELKTAMGDAFQAGPILQSTGDAIRKKVTEPDAKELIGWFESDLGKKLTQAEIDSSSAAAQQDMMSQAQTLLADKERMAFAHKLDKLLHATDERMAFQKRNATAMFTAVSAKLHPDQPADVKAFQQKLDAALKQARPNIEMATLVSFAYTYRNIDVADLKKYGKFLERPAARRFNDSARSGMMAGVDQAMLKLADNIAALAKKKKST